MQHRELKRKKKEEGENGVIGNSNGGTQTIIIKQPLEIVTTKPDVIKVDPTKNEKTNPTFTISNNTCLR